MGGWYIDSATFTATSWFFPFFNRVVSGLTPWVVMKVLIHRGWLQPQLQSMSGQKLLLLTVIFSAASALSHQLVWWWLGRPASNIWIDVWPMFISNEVGALLMLNGFKFALDRWHQLR